MEAAADTGSVTIALLKNVELEAQVDLPAGVTLDGQDNTISVGGSSWSDKTQEKYMVVCDSNVTVKNVTIDAENIVSGALQFYDAVGGRIEGSVTLTGAKELGLNINASQVTDMGAIHYAGNGWNNGINVGWGSDVTADRCSFYASVAALVGVAGIYTGTADVANVDDVSKFSILPPAGSGGAFAILCAPAAAEANGTSYIALATAIGTANPGDMVTLLDDYTVNSAIIIEKDVTLDLNGHVANALNGVPQSEEDDPYKGRMIRVTNGASLTVNGTVKGSGMTIAEDAETVSFIGVDAGSTLTVNGGKYTGDTATYYYGGTKTYPGSYIFIFETGTGEDYNSLITSVTLNDITAESNNSFLNCDTIWGDLTVNVTGGVAVLLSLAMVPSLAACGGTDGPASEEESGQETEESSEGEKLEVAVVLKSLAAEYWLTVKDGRDQAAADLGIEVTVLGPNAESNIEGQVAMIEQMIGAGCDAIVCAPNDAGATAAALQAAVESNVPVLAVDTDVGMEGQTCFVGTSNVDAAYEGGIWGASQIAEDKGAVIIYGQEGDSTSNMRREGYTKAYGRIRHRGAGRAVRPEYHGRLHQDHGGFADCSS